MVVTDPSIDPITGLSVLNPSGPVQQIPLGQEVFPYADLNATAQPTRGPIYGDDIIPTSSLITAPDAQMKPRSVQATTTRELRVREAVFQNKGAAIPDGTTAPIDVNVIGGSGGGGIIPSAMTDLNFFGQAKAKGLSGSIQGIAYSTLVSVFGYSFSFIATGAVSATYGSVWLSIVSAIGGEFILCSLPVTTAQNFGQSNQMFPIPILITTNFDYHTLTLNVGNPDCDVRVTGCLYTNVL